MNVIRGWSTDRTRPLTDPLLEKNGLFIEFRGGDVLDPVQISGNWFTPPFPSRVLRFFCKYPIFPFISYRLGKKGGYIGAKAYGADSEAYKNWMKPEEVYDGSRALCFSFRPFASMKD